MNLRDYVKTPKDRKIVYQDRNLKLEAIFERKDSIKVLNNIGGFYNITLYDNFSLGDNTNQEIFFVADGSGYILFNGRKVSIAKDSAFILPNQMNCVVKNKSKRRPLEMLVISEEAPLNPKKEITIKNTEDIPFDNFNPPLHWCHRSKTIFSYDKDNLSQLHYVSLVYIEPNKLPEPHAHYPGHDEIWHALEGKTKMAFKDNLIEQNPGTTILIPDNGDIPHASITEKERAKFLFIMHHMALDNRLLVTGSSGTVGSIITSHLKNNGYQFITEIDRNNSNNPIDILHDNIMPYFRNIDTVIHLAANPNPFIEKEEADKNIEMTKKVIMACKTSNSIKRIINASSINVYPYRDLEKITKNTPLEQNTFILNGRKYNQYSRAKIESERLLEQFCRENNISLLNLRLGWVTKNDRHPPHKEDKPHPRDLEVALKHDDLRKIIGRAINYEGVGSYVCVSKKEGFINENILFQ